MPAFRVGRVLPDRPFEHLGDYSAAGGGEGLGAARRLGPPGVVEHLEASGLRGRGGAGFPTGRKWRTVAQHAAPGVAATVVVNAAEGEPGSFKDRAILRASPYAVLEGALVAAHAVGADRVIVALKASFAKEADRLRDAIHEMGAAGWPGDVELSLFAGPDEYLYGEETALLEVIDGRAPFPRIAPPFRQGVDEVGEATASAAETEMAAPGDLTAAAPTLVNNVETLANVPLILARGPEWFRELGTDASPGTVVCTVSGRTRRHGVGETVMGTPLSAVIEEIGGGPEDGRRIVAVMSGVAHPLLPAGRLDAPVSYEGMEGAGTGLGAAGFVAFDDTTDLAAVAAGVARFLGIESCGQCTPCKQDGLALAGLLSRVCASEAGADELDEIRERLRTVTDGARCFLAHQQQRVVESIMAVFPEDLRAHTRGQAAVVEPELIAPIVDIRDGEAVLDERHREKQPDWTYDAVFSGQAPADRIDQRAPEPVRT